MIVPKQIQACGKRIQMTHPAMYRSGKKKKKKKFRFNDSEMNYCFTLLFMISRQCSQIPVKRKMTSKNIFFK